MLEPGASIGETPFPIEGGDMKRSNEVCEEIGGAGDREVGMPGGGGGAWPCGESAPSTPWYLEYAHIRLR